MNSSSARRKVGFIDVDAGDLAAASDGIGELYRGTVDVILVRGAFADPAWIETGRQLDRADAELGWARPNIKMPVEDVRLLGTSTPATPTFQAPRGAAREDYLEGASAQAGEAVARFPNHIDPVHAVQAMIARCAGGRPVELARAVDGRPYVPLTIRRLVPGTQIGIHHDSHYGLELYRALAPRLDTSTMLSWVVTLHSPEAGGALRVYGATSSDADLPRLPNGFSFDLSTLEARYECVRIVPRAGDLFLLAAGRCLHRVERIEGDSSRVTLGGFMALDRPHERVLIWS
jgi:hypothetical protein